jgi:DNA-binding NtrC family response regulator
MDLLRRYPWPGNVRELRNAVERAVVIAAGSMIDVEDLPERVRDLGPQLEAPAEGDSEAAGGCGAAGAPDEINLKAELARHEAELIQKALDAAGWDRNLAARRLGLPLRTLSHKIQVHGLRKNG